MNNLPVYGLANPYIYQNLISNSSESRSSQTKGVDWYGERLSKNSRGPLNSYEIINIEKAIKQNEENTPVKVNRSVQEFLKENKEENKKFRILILGAGEIHKYDSKDVKKTTYTVDIDDSVNPDLVASINDQVAMNLFPDESFNKIVWECVPGVALLNTVHFNQMYRILEKDGKACLTVPSNSARILPILMQETAFKDQLPINYYSDDLRFVTEEFSNEDLVRGRVAINYFENVQGRDYFLTK